MKILLKVLLIIIAVAVIIVYGGVFLCHKVFFKEDASTVPSISGVSDGVFILGVQAHQNHPSTVEEFLPVLADQLKRYNNIAPFLWPDNKVINQSIIIEKINGSKFWLIDSNGGIKNLSKKQALSYGFKRLAYVDGFSFFDGGLYYAVSDNDIKNILDWQKYLHLGTHDTILFLTHEKFHNLEQSRWKVMENISNKGRNEFLDNIQARAKRDLLQKQLFKAVSETGNTQLVLEALATYEDWKNKFPGDYNNSIYFDRIEGTAYYYELISGLYIGYPDIIKNNNDIDRALSLLATRGDVYTRHGVAAEGYSVGGFSCVLLERFVNNWKEDLMNTGDATPIEMLYRHFKDMPLPPPEQQTQVEINVIAAQIEARKDIKPRFFRFLYDILF